MRHRRASIEKLADILVDRRLGSVYGAQPRALSRRQHFPSQTWGVDVATGHHAAGPITVQHLPDALFGATHILGTCRGIVSEQQLRI